jgi:hypothetical protein
MKLNIKLLIIFILLVVIPVVYPIALNCVVKDKYFYSFNCSGLFFIIFSFLPIVGSVLIYSINYIYGKKSILWTLISGLVFLISMVYLYSIYSLSNFGF